MKQWLAAGLVGTAIFFAAATTPDAQQAAKPAAAPASQRPYVAPKTPWGDPDEAGGKPLLHDTLQNLQRFTVRSMKSTSSRETLVSGVPTESSCDEWLCPRLCR